MKEWCGELSENGRGDGLFLLEGSKSPEIVRMVVLGCSLENFLLDLHEFYVRTRLSKYTGLSAIEAKKKVQ